MNYIRHFSILALLLIFHSYAQAQTSASPSNWLYPYGNSEATRQQTFPTTPQVFDSIVVKWANNDIHGVQPLIGNVVNNQKLIPTNPWSPNEIVAAIGDTIVIIGANGKMISKSSLSAAYPQFSISSIKSISVLFDSTAILPNVYTTFPVIMGLEVIEHPAGVDNMIRSYIVAYNKDSNRIELVKRLALSVSGFGDNNFASVTPVFGRSNGTDMLIYTTVNMSQPTIDDALVVPYFRGIAQFNTKDFKYPFPGPDIFDTVRGYACQEVTSAPPSITVIGNKISMLLPCRPTRSLNFPQGLDDPVFSTTYPEKLNLLNVELQGNLLTKGVANAELNDLLLIKDTARVPRIRPLFVSLSDAGRGGVEKLYILITEEYGLRGVKGTAGLHLYDATTGIAITVPNDAGIEDPSFKLGNDHAWSVSIGDVDGNFWNDSSPYFPNNPGNEIVVTHSTPELSVADNKLMVLRYRTGTRITKLANRDSLNYFDTIATKNISGWVAAVSDFDGALDGKAEIFVVDGSTLRVYRMRNYNDSYFLAGDPFETPFSYSFGEPISSVEIADVDGDGYNDIIVSTAYKTYLLGRIVLPSIKILTPKIQNFPPDSYCQSDIVNIQWENQLGGNYFVNIYFQPYLGNIPSGNRISIATKVDNSLDFESFNYSSAPTKIFGDGRFIIEGFANSNIKDSTAILRFNKPKITFDAPIDLEIHVQGDVVTLTGATVCVGQVQLQFKNSQLTTATWSDLATVPVQPDGTYSYQDILSCYPFFQCFSADIDSIISYRAISQPIGGVLALSDTTNIRRIVMRPDTFSLIANPPPELLCPERSFSWLNVPFIPACDSLTVSISFNKGKTFQQISRILRTDANFIWSSAPDTPDSVIFRFCCESSCARKDILVIGSKPKYVNIVAPNPFDPTKIIAGSKPGVNVVYSVPEAMNLDIEIYDQSNRLIAKPVQGEQLFSKTTYCDNWDGTSNGRIVANGMYYLIMKFSNGTKQIFPVYVAKGY